MAPMSLNSFPDELLLNIVSHCGLVALRSLALVNRHLSDLAIARGGLYKKYSHVTINFGPHEHESCGHHPSTPTFKSPLAFTFLGEVLDDPMIGEFVETLSIVPLLSWKDIDGWADGLLEGGAAKVQHAREMIENEVGFVDEFVACPYLHEKAEKCAAAIYDGDEDPAIALLLTLLPNLKDLLIFLSVHDLNVVKKLVQKAAFHAIKTRSTDTAKSHGDSQPILSKLRRVNILHNDSEGGETLDNFRPFALLPSMRHLMGFMIERQPSYDPFPTQRVRSKIMLRNQKIWPHAPTMWCSSMWPYPPSVSNVETIKFDHSAIHASKFSQFLCAFKHLRNLDYQDGSAIVGYSPCNSHKLLKNMPNAVKNSLETLKLYEDLDRYEPSEDEDWDGQGDKEGKKPKPPTIGELLAGFKKLSKINLQLQPRDDAEEEAEDDYEKDAEEVDDVEGEEEECNCDCDCDCTHMDESDGEDSGEEDESGDLDDSDETS